MFAPWSCPKKSIVFNLLKGLTLTPACWSYWFTLLGWLLKVGLGRQYMHVQSNLTILPPSVLEHFVVRGEVIGSTGARYWDLTVLHSSKWCFCGECNNPFWILCVTCWVVLWWFEMVAAMQLSSKQEPLKTAIQWYKQQCVKTRTIMKHFQSMNFAFRSIFPASLALIRIGFGTPLFDVAMPL